MILATDVVPALGGPFVSACALLFVAGAGKVAHPEPAQVAARAAGFPVPRAGVIAFGCIEVGAGVAGALFGGPTALAVASCYLVLTIVAIRLLLRAPSTPCACLGGSNTPVTPTHVALNVVAMVIAVVAAFGRSPVGALSGHWLTGALFAVLVGCCVKLAMLVLETLPELAAATKEGTP
ncbi:MAG TPA: MauE/DoxX family redox-associated membrane protein [Acidimicrobiia bacterium]|nr:MauE/DoxX family redox-associated membrane protein [Acidimicrobiia bacterium]